MAAETRAMRAFGMGVMIVGARTEDGGAAGTKVMGCLHSPCLDGGSEGGLRWLPTSIRDPTRLTRPP
jgi:hypothetical protein